MGITRFSGEDLMASRFEPYLMARCRSIAMDYGHSNNKPPVDGKHPIRHLEFVPWRGSFGLSLCSHGDCHLKESAVGLRR